MKTINAKITRASVGDAGRSLWVTSLNYPQKQTLQAINSLYLYDRINRRSKYLKPDEMFILTIKLKETIYHLNGYCNDKRGDFYINSEEWIYKINIDFEVGKTLECEILGIQR